MRGIGSVRAGRAALAAGALLLAAFAGCAADEAADSCAGSTALIYNPAGKSLDAWPDDYFTVDDPGASTGVRVRVVPGENVVLGDAGVRFRKVFEDLSRLDGFGTTAGLFLRFSGPVDAALLPQGDGGALRADDPKSPIVLLDLSSTPPLRLDAEVSVLPEDDGDPATMLRILPMVPLREGHKYGLAVTDRLRAPGGGCIAGAPAMRQVLAGTATDPGLQRVMPRVQSFVSRLVETGAVRSAQEVLGAVVFTTQHTTADSIAIAKDIRGRKIAYERGACRESANGLYRICEGKMAASDYRTPGGFVDEAQPRPQAAYKVPVVTYLPRGRTAPYPTLLYGHGLNGDRFQAERLAELSAPRGYATVAIDAVKHGDHPDKTLTIAALDFFGISTQGQDLVDTRKLRDAFRQSTYDKLQVVEMLRPGVDVDGDGKVDVNLDQFTYLGVSLGGIMAAEFLAFAPEVRVAMPIVPGARVTDIVRDGQIFAPAMLVFRGQSTAGEVTRFFSLLQSSIDRGDAGVYARHILRERLPGFDARQPQLLMQMVINDDTVPNSTNRYYARSLGAPLVGEQLQVIGTVPHLAQLPTSKNIDGTHTAGVFQYDVVYDGDGPKTKMATHGNVAANPLTIEQTLRFIESGLHDGVAEILDPYRTRGVKK